MKTRKINWKPLAAFIAVMVAAGLAVTQACKEEPTPVTCDCPNEATHLEQGPDVTCPADACPHTGDCTVKVNEMLSNGTTKIVKEVGVNTTEFNGMVVVFNTAHDSMFNEYMRGSFKANVTEVRVGVTNTGISYNATNKVLTVGCDELESTIFPYLLANNIITVSQLNHQTKTEWLASNKGRGWVADYMEAGAIVRVSALDRVRGISI